MPLKPRLSSEKYEHVVVLTGGVGGEDELDHKKETTCFVPSTLKWLSLPMMPYPCSHHGAAVCGGLLYVMGGANSAPLCCFSPKQNKWNTHGRTLNLKDCCYMFSRRSLCDWWRGFLARC